MPRKLDARAQDYAGRIVAEASQLDRLIQDLLSYSQLTRIEVTLRSTSTFERHSTRRCTTSTT